MDKNCVGSLKGRGTLVNTFFAHKFVHNLYKDKRTPKFCINYYPFIFGKIILGGTILYISVKTFYY